MTAKGFKRATAAQTASGDAPAAFPSSSQPPEPRRDPAVALAAAAAVAPTLPPTRLDTTPLDPISQLNLKVRTSLIDQLSQAAAREGTTQKVIVCRALLAAGYQVHPDDLADRGNHRRHRS